MAKILAHPSTLKVAKPTAAFYWILASSALLCSLRNPQYQMGIMNDDAIYALGARSLAHGGQFTSLLLKGDYPMPGLPLLLAPFVRMIEPHWLFFEWFSILATLLAVFLFYRWVSPYLSKAEASVATALIAFNPGLVRLSGVLMPEPYYVASVLGIFLLLSQWLENPTRSKALAIGCLAGWAALMRPEGVILLLSVMGAVLWTRKGRELVRLTMMPLVLWGLLFYFWWHNHPTPQSEYGSDLSALRSYWSQNLFAGLQSSEKLIREFLFRTVTLVTPPENTLWSIVTWLGVGAVLAAVTTGYRNLWKRWPTQRPVWLAAAIFCILHLVVHLYWHVSARRYSIPMLPFVIFFMVKGVPVLLSHVKSRRIWMGLLLTIVLLSYSYRHGFAIHESLLETDPMKSPPRQSLAWLQNHLTDGSKVMSNVASNIELYVNHPAINSMQTKSIDLLHYELLHQSVTHIVYRDLVYLASKVEGTQDPNATWNQLLLMIGRNPERFSLVSENTAERTKIFQVVPDAEYCKAFELFKAAARSYQAGRLDDAFQIAEKSVALCPRIGNAQNLLGALYLKRGDVVSARDAFKAAERLLPASARPLLNLATLSLLTGRSEDFQEYIRRARKIGISVGEGDETQRNIDYLDRLWAQHQATTFLEFPS